MVVKATVGAAGAVPATIAVSRGAIRVDLNEQEIAELAQSEDALKSARADIALAVARGSTGSTTVAAIIAAVYLASVEVFTTGRIGGAHRRAETTFDISADLNALASNDVVVVVRAGAKGILPIPETLVVLEPIGVPAIGSATNTLPSFWSADGTVSSPPRCESTVEIANLHTNALCSWYSRRNTGRRRDRFEQAANEDVTGKDVTH